MSDEKKEKKMIFEKSMEEDMTLQDKQDQINDQIVKNFGKSEEMMDLIKSATGFAKRGRTIPRLAFSEDPQTQNKYAGIFKLKDRGLLPDTVIKRLRIENHLIASILRARGNTLSMMGHIRKDRFDVGIEVDIKPEFKDHIEPEQMVKIKERIDRFLKTLMNCGYTDGLEETEKMSLAEFLDIQVRNGLSFGRFGTEIIFRDDDNSPFHRFRPVDIGTIFPSVKRGEAAEPIRRSSLKLLEQITGVKIDKDMFNEDEYAWVQSIDGQPKQAFTSKEMLVYNLYPSSDVEHNGFPVTPLDTIITSTTTHLSIEVYNKLYFQNGRASKGMMVIKSDEIDQSVIEDIKQQYNASINNVSNSFRTPIFGVAQADDVEWVSTTPQKKDGEFQFLYDQVTRNILSAFNMAPEELPGYGHLSRGTNQQSLSESNNEYKLLAARDTGIRPLILKIQDFLNEKLFPILDEELAQLCTIALAGFDAETKQQESTRLQQDMGLHYCYDELMDEVEKENVGKHMSGDMPFNEYYNQILDKTKTAGEIISHFNESAAAIVDPVLKYKRDPFMLQHLQMMAEFNPAAVQAYFATRKDSMDILKLFLRDYLDEDSLE